MTVKEIKKAIKANGMLRIDNFSCCTPTVGLYANRLEIFTSQTPKKFVMKYCPFCGRSLDWSEQK